MESAKYQQIIYHSPCLITSQVWRCPMLWRRERSLFWVQGLLVSTGSYMWWLSCTAFLLKMLHFQVFSPHYVYLLMLLSSRISFNRYWHKKFFAGKSSLVKQFIEVTKWPHISPFLVYSILCATFRVTLWIPIIPPSNQLMRKALCIRALHTTATLLIQLVRSVLLWHFPFIIESDCHHVNSTHSDFATTQGRIFPNKCPACHRNTRLHTRLFHHLPQLIQHDWSRTWQDSWLLWGNQDSLCYSWIQVRFVDAVSFLPPNKTVCWRGKVK